MNNLTVTKIDSDLIIFNNGMVLTSDHRQDCCESHYLSLSDLKIEDFEGLIFDLTNDNFFERIPDYGIALKPVNGFPVRIPGYGYNNGYYSDQLDLILEMGNTVIRRYDITECQTYNNY